MEKPTFDQQIHAAMQSECPVDVLEICRENIDQLHTLMDSAMEHDLGYMVFHNDYHGLRAIGIHFHPISGTPCILDFEYDHVMFADHFQHEQGIFMIYHKLAIIMNSDCTNCCDALHFIRLSKFGIYAEGDVSQTYHS